MSFLDQISGVLSNAMSGNLTEEQAHAHYDQMAQSVPQGTLASAIGPALASLEGGQLQQSVTNSATQMNPQQRGDIISTLLSGLGASGMNLGTLLPQLGINPAVQNNPQAATPDEVGKLAAHAQATNPGLLQEATSFYAQHPTLVKALGTMVIAGIARNLAK